MQGYAIYQRGMQQQGYGRRNPGLADLQQLAYMSIPGIKTLVSHDRRLVSASRALIEGRVPGCSILSYGECEGKLLSENQGGLKNGR